MDFLTAVIPWILGCSVSPIKRHINYAFGFRRKVNTLDSEVRKLEIETNSLQSSIVGVLNRGEVVEAYVLDWKTRADKALDEAKSVIRIGEEEAQRSCSLVMCLNLKTRYDIGKKAGEGAPGITQLLEEKGRLGPISRPPDLQQIMRPPVEGYEAHSRAKILKEVMDTLLDPNITMVGVHGMGGIGKTTLVEEVHRQATQNMLFDKVVIATASVTPDLRRIQDEIAEFVIGSKLQESSDAARASRLYQSLKATRVLIILDDLWSELKLDKVGIPTGTDSKGCKILLTSRNSDLLSNNMGSQKNFRIQLLSKEESMSLFEKKVVEIRDHEIAEKILIKCDGFPLMIVTIAGLLRGKGLHVWNDILTQLSRFDNQEIREKVYSVLELSYNHLVDDETRQIFLLCGISDQSNTTLQNLLKYSLGLSVFKQYAISQARNRLKKLIDDLKACNLLEFDNLGKVKMHDTVQEVAISIAHRDLRAFRDKDGNMLNEWPNEICRCNIVSIPYSNIRQLPEDLRCPEVEFVLLSSNKSASFHIPNSTFEQTRQLKIVHFTGIRMTSIPRSLCFLTSLHTLCLEDCHLSNVATIGHFKNLEILSFRQSSLEALPIEIGQLTKLKLLDLSYCSELHSIPVNVISKLTSLEELLMRNSFGDWEIQEYSDQSNARLSELKYLSWLTSLEIYIPNAKALPKDLFSNHLERYQILIGEGWGFNEHSETTKTLKLKFDTSSDLLQKVRELWKELETLHLEEINGFTNLLYNNKGFPKLKQLYIGNSSKLQRIVDFGRQVAITCFPILEYLELGELESLVSICHGRPASGSFSRLKRLEISGCNRLKNLFSVSMLRSLSQLEKIEVQRCHGIEALFVEENDCTFEGNGVMEFSRLQSLNLDDLSQLKCFLSLREALPRSGRSSETTATDNIVPFFNEKVSLPRLKDLILRQIGNIQMIWCNQLTPGAFKKLNSLNISECHKLRKVFPANALGSFQDLKSLELSDCNLLKKIYQFGDVEELNNGPMIWREDSTDKYFKFDKLESIFISYCHGLENILPPLVAKSLSQLKSLYVSSCGKLKEIVAQEECSETLPLFSQLASLTLIDLPELRSLYPGSHTFGCPNLKRLTIRGFNKARIFWSCGELEAFQRVGQPCFLDQPQPFFCPEKVFPSLEYMSVDNGISKSISGSWLKYLIRLKSLELFSVRGSLIEVNEFGGFESIPNLRELVASYSHIKELRRYERSGFDQTDASNHFLVQPSLRKLELYFVKELRHLRRKGSQMDPLLLYLERLRLICCQDLISLAASPSTSFRNLTTLELIYCRKVRKLIKPLIAKTMVNLVTLEIWTCEALEEIVAAEGDDPATQDECIVFNKLKTLKLSYLENLEGFCMSSCYTFIFPCLEEIFVEHCKIMRIFCNGDLVTPKLQNIYCGEYEQEYWEGDLNTTIRQLNKVNSYNTHKLRLSRFPVLVERWGRELPFKLYSQLSSLVVDKCALLPIAIPSNVLPLLSELLELVVEKCDSVEEIFDVDGMDQNEGHGGLMSQLKKLELIELPKLRHVWNEGPQEILGIKNLRELKIHNCGNLTHVLSLPMALSLVHLRKLEVTDCALVKVIIKQEGDWDHHTLLPSLESIKLENLLSLMEFFSSGDIVRCPTLDSVNVIGCPKLCLLRSVCSYPEQDEIIMVLSPHNNGSVDNPTFIIFNNQIEIFNLKELRVQWNSTMVKAWHDIVPTSFLHSLQVIQLMNFPTVNEVLPLDFDKGMPYLWKLIIIDSFCNQILPRQQSFICKEQPTSSFAKLKHLELFNLPEIKNLVEEDSPSVSLFHYLEELQVSKCNGLTWLLTSFTIKGLVNLKNITVKECERITEIVSSNRDGVGDEIVFEQLKSLEFHGLPCLTSFSSGDYAFDFPCLEEVAIKECPNMKTFAKNVTSTPLLYGVQIATDEDEWHWEDGLNSTIEKLFDVQ